MQLYLVRRSHEAFIRENHSSHDLSRLKYMIKNPLDPNGYRAGAAAAFTGNGGGRARRPAPAGDPRPAVTRPAAA